LELSQNIYVSLVDLEDNVIGQMEKLETHKQGLLHRAFSVLIFNDKKELLLQRRAFGKYHSEGLWTNTCCSHPMPEESNLTAAHRRLQEEMGFDCELMELFYFIYKADLDNNLIEHELDHVLIGHSNQEPNLNKDEAIDFKWMNLEEVKKAIIIQPTEFTFWFKIIILEHFNKIHEYLKNESL
jgi:isopentenyl-diphosphate delta-isomerase